MILRVIGIGVLVLASIPAIITFPPLAAAPLLIWFLNSRRSSSSFRRNSASRRTAHRSMFSGQTSRRGQSKSVRRSTSSQPHPLRGVLLVTIGGLFVFSILRAQFENNPNSVALLALTVIGLLFLYLAWRTRRRARPLAWSGSNGYQHGSLLSTVAVGTEFEWHVVNMLKSLDYRAVDRVGGAGDNGIDIVAKDKRGQTFLVQCKCFSTGNRVGSVDVQKLLGAVVHHGADGGIFVTTSTYTPAAIELARSGRVPMTLYDGRDVAHLSA